MVNLLKVLFLWGPFLYTPLAEGAYKYNICNGLSNQLLYHAGPIALAIEKGYDKIEIPAHFIVNGVQNSTDDVLPTESNSVPFSRVFDDVFFSKQINDLGISVTFKTFDFNQPQIECSGMAVLEQANPTLVMKVLQAFQPSAILKQLIAKVKSGSGDFANAVCVHHRGTFLDMLVASLPSPARD